MNGAEPEDVWTFEFEDQGQALAACNTINAKHGPIAELSDRRAIISAPGPTMEDAATLAKQMGGNLKGPSFTWA